MNYVSCSVLLVSIWGAIVQAGDIVMGELFYSSHTLNGDSITPMKLSNYETYGFAAAFKKEFSLVNAQANFSRERNEDVTGSTDGTYAKSDITSFHVSFGYSDYEIGGFFGYTRAYIARNSQKHSSLTTRFWGAEARIPIGSDLIITPQAAKMDSGDNLDALRDGYFVSLHSSYIINDMFNVYGSYSFADGDMDDLNENDIAHLSAVDLTLQFTPKTQPFSFYISLYSSRASEDDPGSKDENYDHAVQVGFRYWFFGEGSSVHQLFPLGRVDHWQGQFAGSLE